MYIIQTKNNWNDLTIEQQPQNLCKSQAYAYK